MIKYLIKKNKTYWYRRKILHYGEIVFSLKTKNYDIAIVRHSYMDYHIKRLIHKGAFETMTVEEIKEIIDKYKSYMLTVDYNDYEEQRDKELSIEIDGEFYGGHTKEALKHTFEHYRYIHAQNDLDLVKKETAKILKRSNIQSEFKKLKTDKEKAVFHWELLKAEMEILYKTYLKQKELTGGIQTEKEYMGYTVQDFINMLSSSQNNSSSSQKKVIRINELIEKYILEKNTTNNWSDKNVRDLQYVFLRLSEHFNNCPIDQLSREDFSSFRDQVLAYLPKQINKNIFKGKNTSEIVEIVKKGKIDTISKVTINKHLRRIHQVFEWAYRNDYINKNLTKDLEFKKTKQERAKKTAKIPYSQEELKHLFEKSPWFNEDIEKTLKHDPKRVFIPLLALFTGSKPTELAMLQTADICTKDGIVGIDFKDHVKTSYSIRFVPIAQTLIDLGFLKYVDRRKKQKVKMLFPKVKVYKGDGTNFTNEFTRFNREYISTSKDKTFYSLRHLVNQKLKDKQVPIYMINDITGHSGGSGNKDIDTYGDKQMSPKILKEVIDKSLVYDLDFTKLKNTINKLF